MSAGAVKQLQRALRLLQATPAPCPAIEGIELVDDSLFTWDVVLRVSCATAVHVRIEYPPSGAGLPTVGVLRPRLEGVNVFDGAVCLQELDLLTRDANDDSATGYAWLRDEQRAVAFFHVLVERLSPPNATVKDADGAFSEDERRGGERRIAAAHPTRDVATRSAAATGDGGSEPEATLSRRVSICALAAALDAIDQRAGGDGPGRRCDELVVELDGDESPASAPALIQVRGNVRLTIQSSGERGTLFGHPQGTVIVVAGRDASLVLRGAALRGLIVATDGGTCACEHASVTFNEATPHAVDVREAIVASCDTLLRSQRTFAAVTVVGRGSRFTATASTFSIVHGLDGQYMPRDAACFVAAGASFEANCECEFSAPLATGVYVDAATAVVSDATVHAVRGVFAFDGATVELSDFAIRATPVSSSQQTRGIWAETLSTVTANRVVVDGADTGFLAIVSATLDATESRAVDCEHGFFAEGARVIANACIAEACVCAFVAKRQAMLFMNGSEYEEVEEDEEQQPPQTDACSFSPIGAIGATAMKGRGCVRQFRGLHAITVELGSIARIKRTLLDLADRRAIPAADSDRTTIGLLCTGVGSRCELTDTVLRGPGRVTKAVPLPDAATGWSVGLKAQQEASVTIRGSESECAHVSGWYEACMCITKSRFAVADACVICNSFIGASIASGSSMEMSGRVALLDFRQTAVLVNAGDASGPPTSLVATDVLIEASRFGIEASGPTARLALTRVLILAPTGSQQAEEEDEDEAGESAPELLTLKGGGRADIKDSVFGAAVALRRFIASSSNEKATALIQQTVDRCVPLNARTDARQRAWESQHGAEDRCVGLEVVGPGAVLAVSNSAVAGCAFGLAAANKALLQATDVMAVCCTNGFTFAHGAPNGRLQRCSVLESRQVGLYAHAASTVVVERCRFDVFGGAFGIESAEVGTSVVVSETVVLVAPPPNAADVADTQAYRDKVGVVARDGAAVTASASRVEPADCEDVTGPFSTGALGVTAFKSQSKSKMTLVNCSARRVIAGICSVAESSVAVSGEGGFAVTDVDEGVKVTSMAAAEFLGPLTIERCGVGVVVDDSSECKLMFGCTVRTFVRRAVCVTGGILRFHGVLHIHWSSVSADDDVPPPVGVLVDGPGAIIGIHSSCCLTLNMVAAPMSEGVKAQQGGQIQVEAVKVTGTYFALAVLGDNTRVRCESLTVEGCSNGITVDGGGDATIAETRITAAALVGAYVPRGKIELRCAHIESPRHALECGGGGAVLYAAGEFIGSIVALDGGELHVRHHT